MASWLAGWRWWLTLLGVGAGREAACVGVERMRWRGQGQVLLL